MTRSRSLALSLFATFSFLICASSFPAYGQLANATNDATTDSSAQAPATHPIVKFNVPGAGTSSGQGTNPYGILADGSILGNYIDSNNTFHGFLRSPAGAITTFDAPGAGTGLFRGTVPAGINFELVIVGGYVDAGGVGHGFLRSATGTFTTIDAPGAGTASDQGTDASSINTKGEIAGDYIDSNGVYHGFVRSPSGVFTTFDDPLAGTGSGQGTFSAGLCSLDDGGAIAGGFIDSSNAYHGFLRTANGSLSTIDPAGSLNTFVSGLSSNQTVAGYYVDSTGLHGFTSLNGVIIPFNAPNAAGTAVFTINSGGMISGQYYDSKNVNHGYVRMPGGAFLEFNVPGAGTGANQGTTASDTNAKGQITGNYVDSNGVNHGFLRK